VRDTTHCGSVAEDMGICLPESRHALIYGPIIHEYITGFIKTENTLDAFYGSVIFKI